MNSQEIENLKKTAADARKIVLEMVTRTKSSHVGSAFSIVDILTVLYFKILNVNPQNPVDENRDRFILSKGHGCSALYAVLRLKELIKGDVLNKFCCNGGCIAGHPIKDSVPGVEATTGSLGHGLSIAAGVALAGKNDDKSYRVFSIVGDGECNEGSIWEAAMFSAQHKLDTLTVIVDKNRIQGFGRTDEIIGLEPLEEKWSAFGWSVRIIDGHDYEQIHNALNSTPFEKGRPSAIIANTVKGKGVSFMEDRLAWHYKSPNEEQFQQAMKELSL